MRGRGAQGGERMGRGRRGRGEGERRGKRGRGGGGREEGEERRGGGERREGGGGKGGGRCPLERISNGDSRYWIAVRIDLRGVQSDPAGGDV